MDDYWNTSDVTSSFCDNFFDDSDIGEGWSLVESSLSNNICENDDTNLIPANHQKPLMKLSASTNKLSGILENISIGPDSNSSAAESAGGRLVKEVGKTIGDKIETWKPSSVAHKRNNSGNQTCLSCNTKDEEILKLKNKLENTCSRRLITLPPRDTVEKIVFGEAYSLEGYREFCEKVELLEASLEWNDSNAILAILLFFRNSTKSSVFHQVLQKHPVASQLYVNYLKQRNENFESLEILKMLGKKEEAAILMYELALSSGSDSKIQNLNKALKSFSDSSLSFEGKLIRQHIDLLESQVKIEQADDNDKTNKMLVEHPRVTSLIGHSLLTTLFYCTMYHWQETQTSLSSPLHFKRYFDISDSLFLWTIIRGRAKVKHWPLPAELDYAVGPKGVFGALSQLSGRIGGGKLVRNVLPADRVVDFFSSSGAPQNVLSAYIDLLPSTDDKLRLGKELKCHQAVVDAYVSLKEKSSLEHYMKQEMIAGSPEYVKAEHALKNMK